ncbi:MAG TPA: hypothetical protein VFK69_12980 [Candidatus Eisenbacteria bacterium]|nr:hypothetical protein [Candidatus Eisenbacteria bacterium]
MGRDTGGNARAARVMATLLSVLGVVAAGSVGFAVGDVLTAPVAIAATSRETEDTQRGADFDWSWRLKPGQTLTIKGINGGIHAVPASNSEAHLSAHKHARRSDPSQVRIEVNTDEDGVTVCAIYPNRHGEPNTCEPGEDSHQHVDNNDVVVDFDAQVPDGVTLRAITVNGVIETEKLDGPVVARTVNGHITVASRAWATATTVNGAVRAELGTSRWRDELAFTTVNGSVTVALPHEASCELDAGTVNGDVETDFPVSVSGRISHRSLHGTLGDGGGHLKANTVNGSIRLVEAR